MSTHTAQVLQHIARLERVRDRVEAGHRSALAGQRRPQGAPRPAPPPQPPVAAARTPRPRAPTTGRGGRVRPGRHST